MLEFLLKHTKQQICNNILAMYFVARQKLISSKIWQKSEVKILASIKIEINASNAVSQRFYLNIW